MRCEGIWKVKVWVTKTLRKTDIYLHAPDAYLLIQCLPYWVQLLTAVSQDRLFKLAPLYSCGCTLHLIFTQTCYTSEILNSNCTMTLALSIPVQLNTLQLYLPFIFMEVTVALTPSFFLSQFIRHLLASLTILLTLDRTISLGTKN